MKWFIRPALLLVWSGLVLAVFHRDAAAPELRYTRVAEGNISQAGYAIWSRGATGYGEVVRADATTWGRIRPVHWLYQSVPFLLTMVRNGDIWHKDIGIPLSERINGDLQTHTLFQLFAISFAMAALAWMIGCATREWWAALLFPIVFAMGNYSLCENLLVNYCDSVEIGQLLFISLFMVSLMRPLAGNAPHRGMEIAGSFFLLLAYGMKETTLVVFPAVLGILCLRLLPVFHPAPAFKRYVIRHALLHTMLAGILLIFIYLHRSGAYVATNYLVHTNLVVAAMRSWHLMALPAEIVRGLIVGFAACAGVLFIEWRPARRLPGAVFDAGALGLVCGALAVGFFVVNLPFLAAMCKYYLPTILFASVSVVMALALVATSLRRQGLKPAMFLWVLGVAAFMLWHSLDHRDGIRRFYRTEYGYRKTVPAVAADIAASAHSIQEPRRVQLVAGRLFQEGALPFWRQLNRFYGVNIAQAGQIVSCMPACERNYFRRYPGHPAVEVAMSETLPDELDAEDVYLVGCRLENEAHQMGAMGYVRASEQRVGNPAIRIAKYSKAMP